jgi:hypothetical protein
MTATSRRCMVGLGIRLVMGLLLFPCLLEAQGQPALVTTTFAIEDSVFPGIKPPERDVVADRITKSLAEHCARHYGFLRWAPSSDSSLSSTAVASLTLRLVGKRYAQDLWSMSLEYTGDIMGRVANLSEVLRTEQLYGPCDDQPAHEPDRLMRDILEKVREQFCSESFRSDLHKYFTRSIPITQDIYVDHDARRLVIPIKWQDLRARRESELEVAFISESKHGEIKLNPEGPILGDNWRNFVQCVVVFFSYPAIDKAYEYVDVIAEKLKQDKVDSLSVFMITYRQDLYPGTSEETALVP